MMLVDKGYYDYDFEKTEEYVPPVAWEDTIKTDEEVDGILSIFGMQSNRKKPETTEELQSYILNQMEEQ